MRTHSCQGNFFFVEFWAMTLTPGHDLLFSLTTRIQFFSELISDFGKKDKETDRVRVKSKPVGSRFSLKPYKKLDVWNSSFSTVKKADDINSNVTEGQRYNDVKLKARVMCCVNQRSFAIVCLRIFLLLICVSVHCTVRAKGQKLNYLNYFLLCTVVSHSVYSGIIWRQGPSSSRYFVI